MLLTPLYLALEHELYLDLVGPQILFPQARVILFGSARRRGLQLFGLVGSIACAAFFSSRRRRWPELTELKIDGMVSRDASSLTHGKVARYDTMAS